MKKEVVFTDNFSEGLKVGKIADQQPWNYMTMGSVQISDAGFDIAKSGDALQVTPTTTNPKTEQPMFTTTAPGQGDHMKWAINVNQISLNGTHGIQVRAGKTLNIEAVISGQQFGTEQQPFGNAVANPNDDLRLGVPLLMAFDPKNMIVFDFALTNKAIYAIYERGKSAGDGITKPAAYSFEIPLVDRRKSDFHRLRLAYNPDTNTIAWYVNDALLYQVSEVGKLIDRKYMYVDNGGTPQEVKSQVFNAGLGLLSLLDGAKDGGNGLVNLTGQPDYYDPQSGAPTLTHFVDDQASTTNKIFGQGAKIQAKEFSVYYTDN